MKKTILFLVFVALVILPAAGMAAVSAPTTPGAFEFTLGGYIKMETSWDSTQMNKNATFPVFRNVDPDMQHGRLKFTANSTRFNLTIKGPKLWGAQVTGFIEADFDSQGNASPLGTAARDRLTGLGAGTGGGDTQTSATVPQFRMRHAMFRMNWPETELLLGQYWGYFSSYTPESANDSACQFVGSPTQRLPQVRLTQKFLGTYTVSMLVGAPGNAADSSDRPNVTPGESSETPQIQGMVGFEKDLYGKAAFYGVPRGFGAQVAAGWQKLRYRSWAVSQTVSTWDEDTFKNQTNVRQRDSQNLDAWIVMGSLFIPVIPTSSANLAGTASISTQWYVGQGLAVFGEAFAQDQSFLTRQGEDEGGPVWADRQLMKRYGGFVQGQYYFSNQWYLNAVWGMSKAFGVPLIRDADQGQFLTPARANTFSQANDPTKFLQQYNLTLWYRPIQSLKFGLQYTYMKSVFFQRSGAPTTTSTTGTDPTSRPTDTGENHRLMFAGYFYF